jgi:hypothetical protein
VEEMLEALEVVNQKTSKDALGAKVSCLHPRGSAAELTS